jgi:hypothetical protein
MRQLGLGTRRRLIKQVALLFHPLDIRVWYFRILILLCMARLSIDCPSQDASTAKTWLESTIFSSRLEKTIFSPLLYMLVVEGVLEGGEDQRDVRHRG